MSIPAPSRVKLTKRAVDTLVPKDKDQVVFDAGLRDQDHPLRPQVFLVQYRCPPSRAGRIRRYTIGPYGESLTPDQARGIAVQVKGKLAAGIDPVSEREAVLTDAAKAAQDKRAKHTNSVEAIAAACIGRYAKSRLRSWREYERMLQNYVLPTWGSRPITEIRRSDVTALLDAVKEKRSAALAIMCWR